METIVIKVGSAVLTQDGKLALQRLSNLVDFIVKLKQLNYKVILVSSGAVAAGYTLLQLDKSILENKQVLASLGQPLLMRTYKDKFASYNILCSQVLLEASDFEDKTRLQHLKASINTMLKHNIIPIVNENDIVAVDELLFGDNDQLSAHITYHIDASLLIILTDIDGYYDDNPRVNPDAKFLKYVSSISKDDLEAQHSSNSEFATGGIVTKLKAANFLLKHNKSMFLTSGFDLQYVKDYMLNNNHTKGTLFTTLQKQ